MNQDNINKLKAAIYEKVDQMEDETLLQMVEEAVTAYPLVAEKDILDELTPAQQQRLRESILQADSGNTVPHDDVKQKAKAWLSR